jgi:hypothetical protein
VVSLILLPSCRCHSEGDGAERGAAEATPGGAGPPERAAARRGRRAPQRWVLAFLRLPFGVVGGCVVVYQNFAVQHAVAVELKHPHSACQSCIRYPANSACVKVHNCIFAHAPTIHRQAGGEDERGHLHHAAHLPRYVATSASSSQASRLHYIFTLRLRPLTNTCGAYVVYLCLFPHNRPCTAYDTGVHGRLADLCKPINRKYSQAISVAAGSRMDHVVRLL